MGFFKTATIACTALAATGFMADAAELTPFQEKVKAALLMEHRSDANRARDDNRDPVRALNFCRMGADMTVLEFGPGSGWYTELLGPLLKDNGRLISAYKEKWLKRLDKLLAHDAMTAVEKRPIDIDWNPEKRKFSVGMLDFGVRDADLALNIREYHNFDEDGAAKLNAATFKALKPGGYYCIIDHTRRHMQGDSPENRRRADPVKTILQVQAAGFVLVDYTDLFYRADDELRYEVGRKTVKGNTDRFSLLFRRPE